MGRRKAAEEQTQQQQEASMPRDNTSIEDLTSQSDQRENEVATNEATEETRPAWPRRSMSQGAVSMRTLQPTLRAGRAESEYRYQYEQDQEAEYEAFSTGQMGSQRAMENQVSNPRYQLYGMETNINAPGPSSAGNNFARQSGDRFQISQSDRLNRHQNRQNASTNAYDGARVNSWASTGPRLSGVQSGRQNHAQGRGDIEWGQTVQSRQSRSGFTSERLSGESERYNRPAIKLPAFTGKEEWKVWINRFEAIAARKHRSEDEKLDELLPRIQGGAGEFVNSQLPKGVLNDYGLLVSELNSRYRVVETSRTFAVKFSNRNQRSGETAEEYAAELKRLYDNAHGYRDQRTRQEDLVRRFLDDLQDETARFQVEFNKEPRDIDEAVYHVVNFLQTRQKPLNRDLDNDRKVKKFVRRAQTPQ